jgi:hypothetical protein
MVAQVRGKLVPRRGIEWNAAELLHALPHFGAKSFVGPVAPRKADDMALLWQLALLGQCVERGQDLAMRQIAGGAEDYDGKRRERPAQVIHNCRQRRRVELWRARTGWK